MKEVNKVIGKQGKYKKLKLTEDDINEIVEGTNDFIFQRDPDNLFVEGSIKDKTEYFDKDDVLERDLFKQKKEPDTQVFKDSEGGIKGITIGGDDEFKKAMSEAMEEGMRESENMRRLGLDPTKMEDALKYSEMKEAGQMEKNITGLSDMSEADALRQKYPGISDDLVDKILIDDDPQRKAEVIGTLDEAFRMMEKGKGADEVLEIFKNTTRTKNSKGGRAGFMDGGASIINPESSMNNSSGLNYLLGEDDNSRVDFKNGLLVPPSKPKKPQDPMMKLMETYNTYQEALPGVSQETKKYLEQDFIKKLADQGFSINDFMTYRMQQNYANGGRAAFGGGGTMGKEDRGYQGGGRDKEGSVSGTAPGAAEVGGGPDDRGNDRQNAVQAMVNAGYTAKEINSITNPSAIDKIKSSRYNTPLTRGILRTGAYMYNPMILGTELRDLMKLKNLYDETKQQVMNPEYGMEDLTYGVPTEYATGGRAGYEEGGPIYSRLGELNTGVSSAEQQLQQINQSIEQAQNTLGSAESGGGGASAVTPSVSGYESSGSELYDSSPAGEVTNPYVAPVGMNSLPSKPDNKFSNSGGISILDDPRYESSISGPENIMPSMPVNSRPINSSPFDMLDPSITNLNQLGPGKIDNQGQDPFRDPVTGGGQPSYGPGGGLGGLLGESGGGPSIPTLTGTGEPQKAIEDPNNPGSLKPINQMPMSPPDNPFGNVMPATPIATAGPSLTQTVDPYKNTMMTGLSQDGQRFDSAQSAFDALVEQTRKYREASPYTRDVIGSERYQGEEGFKNFTNYFNKINNPNYTAPQLQGQLQSSGGGLGQLLGGGIYNSMNSRKENPLGPVQQLADGGIAGLRQGYAKGKGVDLARRGFLKVLGASVAGVAALKSGVLKVLGKSTATTVPKIVTIPANSGAPVWFEGMVNKVLADGVDITKKAATMDGQVVKSLDTPTGKVEVTYDTRLGDVNVSYAGENTALGEAVDMRYVVGRADEGTKGVKPADEFEAVESIPEGQMAGPDDFNIEMGENITGDVKGLYSDTSELAELGGQKPLIKNISETIKKKRVLKQMENDPADFVTDVQGDYDPT